MCESEECVFVCERDCESVRVFLGYKTIVSSPSSMIGIIELLSEACFASVLLLSTFALSLCVCVCVLLGSCFM